MDKIKELELQIKIMANTIDTQEKIIEELKRVLPQANVISSVCEHPKNKWIWEMNNRNAYCELCGEQIEQIDL